MKIENVKDRIKIDQLVARERIESLVEGEITLPDHKPKIEKIISLDGDVQITNQLLREDTLIVTGIVKFKTLYTTVEDEVQSIHALQSKTDFREEISLKEAYDARAVVSAAIEHIEYTKLTDKKIGVKTVIDINTKLQREGTIDIIKNINGGEGIQTLKEHIKYNGLISTSKTKSLVKDTFEIEENRGDVIDILRVDTDAKVKESRVVDGKVIVSGIVDCFIMYYADDDDQKINYINEEIPFTHFAEVEGAEKDMDYSLDIEVSDVNYDIRGNINGNLRIIDIETSVNIEAKVLAQSQMQIVTDAYSTVKKMDIKNQDITLSQTLAKHSIEERLSQKIALTGTEIEKIYKINARAIITDSRALEEKAIVEGYVDLDITYIGKDQSLEVSKAEIPFKSQVEIDDCKGLDIETKSIIADISYEKINTSEIEVHIDLVNNMTIDVLRDISIVNTASLSAEDLDKSKRASITVYMVQKGDTAWDIAKRYASTVEDIIDTNEIEANNIKLGDKIIIEKHR